MPLAARTVGVTRAILAATLAAALGGCLDRAPRVTAETLGWVGVEEQRLKDEFGRELHLRGINARIDGLFDVSFSDGRQSLEPIPAFDESDALAMAAMGFNLLRLPINWSGLEPEEGRFSESYLARIEAVVEACRRAGLYVLVDFHQDAWSKEIGEDGAPLWAILPPPERLLEGPLHDLDERRTSKQVMDAFVSFFTNRDRLQERFVPAWQKVIGRFAEAPHVIGFEPMNEPVIFHHPEGNRLLYAFYDRTAAALRELDTRHTLWLEPDSLRNLELAAPERDVPFADSNVVYSPHLYPMTLRLHDPDAAAWREALTETVDGMVNEAESWGAALVVGEWGQHPGQPASFPYFGAVLDLFEARSIGHAFWLWKEDSQGSWGFFDRDPAADAWVPRGEGMRQLSRPYAMAVPGRLLSQRFDPASRELTVRFRARGGEAAPLLWLPDSWYPGGYVLSVDSRPVRVTGSGRILVPWAGEAGEREIRVGAK